MNIEAIDRSAFEAARAISGRDLFSHVTKATGMTRAQVQRDYRSVAALPGQLTFPEYVRLGVFRRDRFSAAERGRLLSSRLHWPISHRCNSEEWSGVAGDKALSELILRGGGVAVPQTLGVIDRSDRVYPGLRKVWGVDGLRGLLAEAGGARVFCKTLQGMVSFGAIRIEHHDATHIHCTGHPPMTHAAFLANLIGDTAYLLQRALSNHGRIGLYASALATVRMVNLLHDGGAHVPFAVLKLPQGENIADAFWRPGNLACDIDLGTGTIRKVARRGPMELSYLSDHPVVPGLMGLKLPFWQELKALNERAAALFAPIRYQSTDIAITPEGPVVVELNYGGGFDLPQYASGRGLLTPEVQDHFCGHGVDLDAIEWTGSKPKTALRLLG